jgi:hypothetical protein
LRDKREFVERERKEILFEHILITKKNKSNLGVKTHLRKKSSIKVILPFNHSGKKNIDQEL